MATIDTAKRRGQRLQKPKRDGWRMVGEIENLAAPELKLFPNL